MLFKIECQRKVIIIEIINNIAFSSCSLDPSIKYLRGYLVAQQQNFHIHLQYSRIPTCTYNIRLIYVVDTG